MDRTGLFVWLRNRSRICPMGNWDSENWSWKNRNLSEPYSGNCDDILLLVLRRNAERTTDRRRGNGVPGDILD